MGAFIYQKIKVSKRLSGWSSMTGFTHFDHTHDPIPPFWECIYPVNDLPLICSLVLTQNTPRINILALHVWLAGHDGSWQLFPGITFCNTRLEGYCKTCFCNTPSCARQKDVNAHIILPGTQHSTRHMHLKSWHLLQPIATLYSVFFCLSKFIPNKNLSSNIITCNSRFIMQMRFLNCGSFIIHALLPGTGKAFTVSFSAGHTGSCPSTRHMTTHFINVTTSKIWRVLTQNGLSAIFDIFFKRAPSFNTK